MTVKKTRTDIVDDLVTSISTEQPDVDTSVGTVVRDTSIDHIAKQLSLVYEDLNTYRNNTSLINYANLSEEDIDNLAKNFVITRHEATKATGTITFIGFTSFTIPKNTQVLTGVLSDGSSIAFQVTTDTSSLVTYPYQAIVPIEAVVAGINGNVSPGTITFYPSTLLGISSMVHATELTGGTEKETNTEVATRCKDVASQSDIGTKPGYERILATIPTIEAIAVVGPTDEEMQRNAYGSAVDIYIRGSVLDGFTQVSTYDGSGSISLNVLDTDNYYHLPAKSITSVVGLDGGTVFSSTQYTISLDTTSVFAYSQKATDKISFTTSMRPKVNEGVAITGTYNSLIKTAQQLIDAPTNLILATDPLVKEATEVPISISCTIGLYSGYNAITAANDIKNAIVTYITELGLGGDIEEVDIVQVIYNASSGVSYVLEPFTELRRKTAGAGTSESIVIYRSEYPSITTTDITITTV